MSVTVFGEVADSFDDRVEHAIRELDWWVDQYRRDVYFCISSGPELFRARARVQISYTFEYEHRSSA